MYIYIYIYVRDDIKHIVPWCIHTPSVQGCISIYIYIDIYVRDDIKYTHTHTHIYIYIYIYNSLNVSETHCDSPWGASWLCHLLDAVYSTLPLASHIS